MPSCASTAAPRRCSTTASLPVTRDERGALALDGEGEPVEWLLEMRRFDQGALLDRIAEAQALETATIDALATTLAAFHDEAERRPDRGGHAAMAEVIRGNAGDLASLVGPVFEETTGACGRRGDPGRARARARAARAAPRRGLRAPLPRRPAPRQHRAAGRCAGAVRLPGVRRGAGDDRHLLRPRVPADGPAAPRSSARSRSAC